MRNLSKSVEQAYGAREQFIIIGLTGRTGSGCSKVAEILQKEKIQELNLQEPKSLGFSNVEERKYSIIYNFMVYGAKWNPFIVIECSSVILSFVFEKGYEALIDYLNEIQESFNKKSFTIVDFEGLKLALKGMEYMFDEIKKYPIRDLYDIEHFDEDKIKEYFI